MPGPHLTGNLRNLSVVAEKVQLVHPHADWGQFDRFARTGQPVRPLAANVFRGELRRALFDGAEESGERPPDRRRVRTSRRRSDRLAGRIVGIGGLPETHPGRVLLCARGDESHEPGSPADADGKEAGGKGVKGTGVPSPNPAEQASEGAERRQTR